MSTCINTHRKVYIILRVAYACFTYIIFNMFIYRIYILSSFSRHLQHAHTSLDCHYIWDEIVHWSIELFLRRVRDMMKGLVNNLNRLGLKVNEMDSIFTYMSNDAVRQRTKKKTEMREIFKDNWTRMRKYEHELFWWSLAFVCYLVYNLRNNIFDLLNIRHDFEQTREKNRYASRLINAFFFCY